VSVADYGAQAVVIDRLASFGYPFVAEESGETLRQNPELRAKVHACVLPFLPSVASLAQAEVLTRSAQPTPSLVTLSHCCCSNRTSLWWFQG
jgi:hypothetical protein